MADHEAIDFDDMVIEAVPRSELVKRYMFEFARLDALAREMERKWGICRLPLLVDDALADRFFVQHRRTSRALRSGDPQASLDEIRRMINAWRRLDSEATRLGATELGPVPIEAALSDGTIIAIVRDRDEAGVVEADGRNVRVFAASEIARLIEAMPKIATAKAEIEGAKARPTHIDIAPEFWEHGDEIPF